MLLKSGKKFLSVLVASVAVLGISANLVPKVSAGGGRLFQVMDRVGADKNTDELLAMLPEAIENYDRCRFYYNDEIFPRDDFDEDCETDLLSPPVFDEELGDRWLRGGQRELFRDNFSLDFNHPTPGDDWVPLLSNIAAHAENKYPWDNPWLPGGAAYEYVQMNHDLLNDEFLRDAINSLIDRVSGINDDLRDLVASGQLTEAQLEVFENNCRK